MVVEIAKFKELDFRDKISQKSSILEKGTRRKNNI
jgi:hypothetical protein